MRFRNWDLNLKIRLGGETVTNIIFWTFFPFLSIYFADAFGKGLSGLLLVLSQVLSVIANLAGGYCADRFGRKRMMVLASAGQSFGYGLFALGTTAWLSAPALGFAGFAIASLFSSVYWPASQAMVADVVEERHQSGVFALFYTVSNISVVVGPLLGSLLYVDYPVAVLAAASIACALLSILLSVRLHETLPRERSRSDSEEDAEPARLPWHRAMLTQLRDYRVIAVDRVFLLYIVAGVLLAQTFMQLDLLFPVYLKETLTSAVIWTHGDWSLKLTGERVFGFLVSENGVLVVLLTVAVTRAMNALRDRWVFIGSSIVYAVAILLFGQASAFWSFAAVMALFTLGELMSVGIQQTFIARLAPEPMRAQYFAAGSLRFTLGRTLAPLSIPLSAAIGYPRTFGLLAVLAVAAALLYQWMFNLYEKQ